MIEKEEIEIIKSSIIKIVQDFQASRYNFLYEIDLQARLFDELYNSYDKLGSIIQFNIERGKPKDNFGFNEDKKINFNPVKCEYPYNLRFDIAIIDGKLANKIVLDRVNILWELPLKCAIEIKYCLMGYSPSKQFRKFKGDILKLQRYKKNHKLKDFLGIALFFIQDSDEDTVFKEISRELNLIKDDMVLKTGINSYVFVGSKIFKVKGSS